MADQASNKSARNTDGGARCCQKDNRGPIRDLSAAREQLFDLTAAAALLGSRAVGVYNMEVQGEKEVERVFKRAAKWPHLVIPRAVAMADGYYVKIFCDTSQKFLDSLNRHVPQVSNPTAALPLSTAGATVDTNSGPTPSTPPRPPTPPTLQGGHRVPDRPMSRARRPPPLPHTKDAARGVCVPLSAR